MSQPHNIATTNISTLTSITKLSSTISAIFCQFPTFRPVQCWTNSQKSPPVPRIKTAIGLNVALTLNRNNNNNNNNSIQSSNLFL